MAWLGTLLCFSLEVSSDRKTSPCLLSILCYHHKSAGHVLARESLFIKNFQQKNFQHCPDPDENDKRFRQQKFGAVGYADDLEHDILLCSDDLGSSSDASDLGPVMPSMSLTLPLMDLAPIPNDGGEGKPCQGG